ncbi:hypothetical protein RO3G_01221 [Lichtheimia corymbifera JMRC:FSU:9682]|uniref:Uncharacterized protein n=1 Tax=Lichtheimia corymbifera JMRC:FSU:9682 TaxID=1263082 RepID=A0A068SEY9_9FUNG|nr:hypothetical protein RO3G_01221 [Lichtheimia corymbifera JMRC:FSU:9682]
MSDSCIVYFIGSHRSAHAAQLCSRPFPQAQDPMTYPGFEELKDYITKTQRPNFKSFVGTRIPEVSEWSMDTAITKPEDLHGTWWRRYKQVYMSVHNKDDARSLQAPKYNQFTWNVIMDTMDKMRKLRDTYETGTITLYTAAATPAKERAMPTITTTASSSSSSSNPAISNTSSPTISNTSSIHTTSTIDMSTSMDDSMTSGTTGSISLKTPKTTEQMLYNFGIKKFCGSLKKDDKENIAALKQDGTSIKYVEAIAIQRGEYYGSAIYTTMRQILSPKQIDYLDQHDIIETYCGLELPTIEILKDIIENCEHVDAILARVYKEKLHLVENGKRKTNIFKALSILEIVTESLDYKIPDDASELAYYRRFAMLLDVLYRDTDINMIDGENISEATRDSIEHNQDTFGFEAVHSTGRRIDLMIRLADSNTELSANEWKSKKTSRLILKQQSKNVRSNCAILNKLHIMTHTEISQVMAVEFVGSVGYLYLLQLKNALYVPSVLYRLHLPSQIEHLPEFLNTIKALFLWKEFVESMVKKLRTCTLPQQLDKELGSSLRYKQQPDTFVNTPPPSNVFHIPSNHREKKTQIV